MRMLAQPGMEGLTAWMSWAPMVALTVAQPMEEMMFRRATARGVSRGVRGGEGGGGPNLAPYQPK